MVNKIGKTLDKSEVDSNFGNVSLDEDDLTETFEDKRLVEELNKNHHHGKKIIDRTYSSSSEELGSSFEQRSIDKKAIDKQSLDYIVRSGIAGGIAGSAAKTLVAPLDRVKILFQTSNPAFRKYSGSTNGLLRAVTNIYKNDGLIGLYQGHSATLLRIFPYAAIKFVLYEQIRTLLIPNDDYETVGRRFMAGSLSGVTSVFFTYPLDLIRVRLAFQTNHGPARGRLLKLIKSIYHERPSILEAQDLKNEPFLTRYLIRRTQRGVETSQFVQAVSNFYRGFAPTLLGMIPYAGVSFYTHDLIHDIFRSKFLTKYTVSDSYVAKPAKSGSMSSHDVRAPLNTWAQLIAGGIAGAFSQTALYPFEVVRRRMQVGGVVNNGQFFGVSKTSKMIFKERGLRGFYIGLSIGFIKVVPMFSCSFFVYERCKTYMGI